VKKQNELISVIITCYREGELIHRAFKSVYNQSVMPLEVILVNDCSPDEKTNEICLEYAQKGIVYKRLEKNGGLSAARNEAFEMMKGDIAVVLDADDTLPLKTIELTEKAFLDHPDADFVFGNYEKIIIESGDKFIVDCSILSTDSVHISPYKLAEKWIIMGQSPCKKSLWQKIGGYKPEFSYTNQDVDFWRRAIMAGAKGFFIPEVIYNWHVATTGMNSNVKEEHYFPLRISSLPFFEIYNPKYATELKKYIMRTYIQQLDRNRGLDFYHKHSGFFSYYTFIKLKFMRFSIAYKMLRLMKNLITLRLFLKPAASKN
jgi:glycosyltransferase involved in cell wall biosynthesis